MSVLDTSAVLAMIYGETGGEVARKHADPGSISRVNVAEVLTDLIRTGYGTAVECMSVLGKLDIRFRSIYDDQTQRVAELKQIKGLSLGDCFCIALAESIREPLVTADQQWGRLSLSVPVILIR